MPPWRRGRRFLSKFFVGQHAQRTNMPLLRRHPLIVAEHLGRFLHVIEPARIARRRTMRRPI